MTLPTPKTFDEIKQEIVDYLRQNLSPNVDFSPGSIIGNLVNAMAGYAKSVVDNEVQQAVNQSYWSTAEGPGLARLFELFNLQKIPAAASVVEAELTIEGNSTVPAGAQATFTDGQFTSPFTWELVDPVVNNDPGVQTLPGVFRATVTGPAPQVLPNQLNTILSSEPGWNAVNNTQASSPGRNEETDNEFRFRQRSTLLRTANGTQLALQSALGEIRGVNEVLIFENRGSVTDAKGLPPNSFSPVLVLGSDPDLASIRETIATKSPLGIDSFGTTTTSFTDPDTGITLSVRYSLASTKQVYLWVDIKVEPGVTIPETALANHIISEFNRDLRRLGLDLAVTKLYSYVYNFSSSIKKVFLEGSDVNDRTQSKAQIVALVDEILDLEVANIFIEQTEFVDE